MKTSRDSSHQQTYHQPPIRIKRDKLEAFDRKLRCHLCSGTWQDPRTTPCQHVFCRKCIDDYLRAKSDCPTCGLPLYPRNLQRIQVLENILEIYSTWVASRQGQVTDQPTSSLLLFPSLAADSPTKSLETAGVTPNIQPMAKLEQPPGLPTCCEAKENVPLVPLNASVIAALGIDVAQIEELIQHNSKEITTIDRILQKFDPNWLQLNFSVSAPPKGKAQKPELIPLVPITLLPQENLSMEVTIDRVNVFHDENRSPIVTRSRKLI
jgi:hypothetical protein